MTWQETKHEGTSKLMLGWLVAFVMVFALIGVNGLALAAPTSVTFWHALGSDHQDTLESLVAEFNEANPDIEVEAIYQGNYGSLQQKLVAAVAAQSPPTLSLVYNNWTDAFVDAGAIVPMAQFIDDASIGLSDDEKNDYIASFVAANSWQDEWTTMPFNKSIYVLYYNEDLLAQAGVEVPETMEDLRAAAKAVTEKTGVPGLVLQADIDQFGIFFNAFDGQWVDENNNVAFHREAGVKALQFMQDLVHTDGSAYYHDGYLDDEFNLGNTAMFFATVATIPWLSSDQHAWGAAPIPAGDVQAAVVQGTDIAIFNKATEEEQKAAWEFVKWLTSPEINAHWAIETGYLPVRDEAVNTAAYQDHIQSAPHKYEAGVEQLHAARFDPGIAAWSDARALVTEAAERALILQDDPADALQAAADETSRALKN